MEQYRADEICMLRKGDLPIPAGVRQSAAVEHVRTVGFHEQPKQGFLQDPYWLAF